MNTNSTRISKAFDGHICMIGLGHVGLTLALALADVGYSVTGYDIKPEVRDALKRKESHFKEKGLPELLEKHIGNRFLIVDSLLPTVQRTAYVVTVGTPFREDNTPDYTYIKEAASVLGRVVNAGDMVMLRSTVPLGTTRETVVSILERDSGLTVGKDIHVAFAPERTVEGNAFHELRSLPQIIGGFNPESAEHARAIFSKLTDHIVMLDTLEEAEVVKLINNTYRETVFAFANQVSLLTRAWDLNTKKVIDAANAGYSRSKVPYPSPGVGGYCLTKDGYLFTASAKKKNVDTRLLAGVRQQTSTMIDVITEDILNFAKLHHKDKNPVTIGVLGFAFKGTPETSDVRGSNTYALLKRLNFIGGYRIIGYDTNVHPDVIKKMGAVPQSSVNALTKESDVIIAMNNHPSIANIGPDHFSTNRGKVLFFDTWGVADQSQFDAHPHVEYWRL
jgi:UDP-N-acetyl-D-mannosaminuronic acid dehydrogenase